MNLYPVSKDIVLGGEINIENPDLYKSEGIKLIVDLRPPLEGTDIEKNIFEDTEIEYFNIPISDNINNHMIESLEKKLKKYEGQPTIIHCKSGRRVGILWGSYIESSNNKK